MKIGHFTAVRRLFFAAPFLKSASNAVSIDAAILLDLIPKGSEMCIDSGTTASTFDFADVDKSVSGWSATNAQYEEGTFLAEMSHQDTNSNRTWNFRVGKGGNIYSFIGAYGEAAPIQYHQHGAWVDDVPYMGVAVDTDLNRNGGNDNQYFIHQAGTYQGLKLSNSHTYDVPYTPPAFYSPSVAKHCEENSCSFASWGQQAHIPTKWKSDMLYFYNYRDCNNGVIEVTQTFHNNAEPGGMNNGGADTNWYLNTPWGGVRATVLTDVLLSDLNGNLHLPDRFECWDDTMIKSLDTTGGFTTFAQDYPSPEEGQRATGKDELPCHDGTNLQNANSKTGACTDANYAAGYEDLKLVVQKNNPCRSYSLDTCILNGARCDFVEGNVPTPISAYCYPCNGGKGFTFTNSRTSESVLVTSIVHWNWKRKSYFPIPDGVTIGDMNRMFTARDEVIVSFPAPSVKLEDNIALTFVHGKGEEYEKRGSYWIAKPRMRWGKGCPTSREYTVFVSLAKCATCA